MLLSIEGSGAVRRRAAEMMNFAEGVLWSEPGAGTNAIGTAIAADHAVQVFGPEHFNEPVQRWTCSAAPIHDPDTGELLGVIDLTGDSQHRPPAQPRRGDRDRAGGRGGAAARAAGDRRAPARPLRRPRRRRARAARALVAPSGRPITALPPDWMRRHGRARACPPGGGALVLPSGAHAVAEPVGSALEAFVVHAVEQQAPQRTARPLLKLRMLGRDRAQLQLSGDETEVRPRLAEILALLCANPHGYSAEALCADLHGDGGSPGSVRVEVAGCASCSARGSTPSATGSPATSRPTCAASRACSPPAACATPPSATPARCCPSSEAPGVVRERERLDRWLRQAVMTSDDPEALWAWVQTPTGEDDLGAWKRLLSAAAVPRSAPRALRRARRRAAAGRCNGHVTPRWCTAVPRATTVG